MTGRPTEISAIEDTRRSMSRSGATRVARTRQAIFDAVESMPAGEPVTVSEVVRRAGISRAAFYTHFAGLDELAIAIMHDMLAKITTLDLQARRTTHAGWRETSIATLTRNVEQMVHHRGLYLSVLGMPGSSTAFEAAVRELSAVIAGTIAEMPAVPPDVELTDAARFIASGTLSLIVHWLRTDPHMEVDTMVARLVVLLPDWGA
ncbi:TetR/AcrR family transcriptional regulator [uncultured Microbacterium sp.]|uniref:TetR/AcrR family transcriptional regulator n=1 Tax=uncultured Microbacterium sp. TaxID=191216 RepID=UPI0035CB7D5C